MAWWNFERLYTHNTTGIHNLDYEGRHVWGVGTYVYVYDTYNLDQYLSEIESFVQPEPNRDLNLRWTIELPTPGYFIKVVGDVGYVTEEGSPFQHEFNKIYVVDLKYTTILNPNAIEENIITINCPDTMMSNIHYFYGKLWMVGQSLIDDEHSLYSYDLSSQTWNSTIIPVRKQLTEPFYVHDDKAGHVLITNFNNLSVSKMLASSGAHVSTIRLDDGSGANREPHRIYTASDLTVYVASLNGMISLVNTTADTVDHQHNALGTPEGICYDGTYLWFASGELIRSRKSDNDIRQTNGEDPDYSFNTGNFPSTGFTNLVKTIAHDYEDEDGTHSVSEFIFMTTGTHVIAFVNDDTFFRNVYSKLDGVGMISSGQHDYTGD